MKIIDKILAIGIIIVIVLIYIEISNSPRDTQLENFYKQQANGLHRN